MKSHLPILALLASIVLPACQEEVISRRSSFDSRFGGLNKSGWSVASGEQPNIASRSPEDDPNVRVIRPADFSGYQFNTTFTVDDPRLRPQPPSTQPANTQPGMNPWGAAPVAPGS